jgi:arsenite oxidase small subunit
MKAPKVSRRIFFKTCISTATLVAANPRLLAQSDLSMKVYAPALLVDEKSEPLTSKSFVNMQHYIFHYPFHTTPCFLINLDSPLVRPESLETENDSTYLWPGGVGPEGTLVAFSAICAHKLSYATRTTSFINFRPEEISYVDSHNKTNKNNQLIYCCSERSVYDPAKGAKVVGGPARQPLTTIIIEHEMQSDNYYATATLGGELYNEFFDKFGFRLALDNNSNDIRRPVENSTIAYTIDRYTSHAVKC